MTLKIRRRSLGTFQRRITQQMKWDGQRLGLYLMSAFFLLSGAALFLDLVVEDKSTLKTGVGDKYGDNWETPPPLPLLSRFFFCDDHGDNHDDHYHGDNHDDHDDNYDVLCDSRDNDHPGEDLHGD